MSVLKHSISEYGEILERYPEIASPPGDATQLNMALDIIFDLEENISLLSAANDCSMTTTHERDLKNETGRHIYRVEGLGDWGRCVCVASAWLFYKINKINLAGFFLREVGQEVVKKMISDPKYFIGYRRNRFGETVADLRYGLTQLF